MENQRVMAYNLSKEINNNELSMVSGGAAQVNWSHRPSGHISGSNGSWDSSIDVVIDW